MRAPVLFLLICLTWILPACVRDQGKSGESGPAEDPGDPDKALVAEQVRGPVTVRLKVEPGKPTLSDEILFTLTILSEEGVEVEPPAVRAALGEFLMRDFKHDLPDVQENRQVHRSRYTLEALRWGPHLIRPLKVKCWTAPEGASKDPGKKTEKKEHVLETEPLKVEVGSILGEARPDLKSLRGPRGLRDVAPPERPVPWLWIGGIGGLVILAVIGLVFWIRRGRKVPEARKYSPEELAYMELQALVQADWVAEGRFGEFYVELTGIVRRYIERTTRIHAPEQTTEEFLREMRHRDLFDADRQTRLARFLEAADLIKFAARVPGNEEIESSFNTAKAFVGLEQMEHTEKVA